MKQPNLAVIILAAGQSTRMKSQLSKMLHPLCGRPIVRYVTDLAEAAQAQRLVMVVGYQADKIQKELSDTRVEFVHQKERLGTAHAISQTTGILADFSGTVLIVNGDTPLLSLREIGDLIEFHTSSQASGTILTSDVPDPFGYGRIQRDGQGNVLGIVEEKEASEDQKKIREINSGVYCFDSQSLFGSLDQVDNRNAKGEYYLTDVIAILRREGKSVQALKAPDYQTALGINTRMDLAEATRIMRQRIADHLMQEGVTLIDPANTYIDLGVRIGRDTVICPGCVIEGNSSLGQGCYLGPFSWLVQAVLEDGVSVEGRCFIRESVLPTGLQVPADSQISQGTFEKYSGEKRAERS